MAVLDCRRFYADSQDKETENNHGEILRYAQNDRFTATAKTTATTKATTKATTTATARFFGPKDGASE